VPHAQSGPHAQAWSFALTALAAIEPQAQDLVSSSDFM